LSSRNVGKIIIIGGKGTAINIAEQIIQARLIHGRSVEFLGYAIDDESLGDSINGYPVLCKINELKEKYNYPDVGFIFALFKPDKMKERKALLRSYGIDAIRFTTFVHPLATLARNVTLGMGSVILSHSTLHTQVKIGNFTIINSNVVVEHNTVIGDSNFISASVCIGSHITIGCGTFIGLNSTLRENVRIGDYAFVGMGSNVINDVGPGKVVYGNPAKAKS